MAVGNVFLGNINVGKMTGEELKILRKKYSYTQKGLAEELDLERVRITEWEGMSQIPKITGKMFELFFENKKLKEEAKN